MRSRYTVWIGLMAASWFLPGIVAAQSTLTVADTSMAEGDSGSRVMMFAVRLSAPTQNLVSFSYRTIDGTATVADGDYDATAGQASIPPGSTQVLIPVMIRGDSLIEANERFTLEISAVQLAAPLDTIAVGTILNDDRTHFAWLPYTVSDFGPGTLPPCWGDANGDGLPDLPMYQNIGGVFVEWPGFRSLLGDGNYHGGAWCDYDRDGDADLVLMPYGDDESAFNYTRLIKNTPTGFFDIGSTIDVDVTGHGETPTWGDFDGDGWPDLFLPFYGFEFPFRNYFYRNRGDGTFQEMAQAAGVALEGTPIEQRPEGVAAGDWNGDGALDLYVASHLFLNDGTAHFTDVRASVGLPMMFDEGAQFVDFDNDGDLDLYLRTANGPTLFRNDNGTFVDVTASLGIGFVDWNWGDRWCDVDMDGDLDLLYFDPTGAARLMLNRGDGTFEEDSSFRALNFGGSLSAFADMDGDGDMDIVIGAYGKEFARNLLDQAPHAHTGYLKVLVEDDEGYQVEQGATVKLRSLDDPTHPIQTRIVDGGSGYLGQDEYELTFGGVESGRFDLEVDFPSRPQSRVVVGPDQNPLLAGIEPGIAPPKLYVVRPNHAVEIRTLAPPPAAVAESPARGLAPVTPNPVRELAHFRYVLPRAGSATMTIYDLAGRRVFGLTRSAQPAGPGNATWDLRADDGRPVGSGLYFARLESGGRLLGTQRIVVLR